MTQRWLAVYSTPAAQGRVYLTLEDQGYSPFMPMEAYWEKHRRGEREKTIAPLFLGYTFARCQPERTGELTQIKGIQDVLRGGDGRPAWVPDEVIEALRRAWRGRVFDRTQEFGLPVGSDVLITGGPFAGIIAKIKSASSKHRPRVLLTMLGRVIETSIPIDRIEQIRA